MRRSKHHLLWEIVGGLRRITHHLLRESVGGLRRIKYHLLRESDCWLRRSKHHLLRGSAGWLRRSVVVDSLILAARRGLLRPADVSFLFFLLKSPVWLDPMFLFV